MERSGLSGRPETARVELDSKVPVVLGYRNQEITCSYWRHMDIGWRRAYLPVVVRLQQRLRVAHALGRLGAAHALHGLRHPQLQLLGGTRDNGNWFWTNRDLIANIRGTLPLRPSS